MRFSEDELFALRSSGVAAAIAAIACGFLFPTFGATALTVCAWVGVVGMGVAVGGALAICFFVAGRALARESIRAIRVRLSKYDATKPDKNSEGPYR